MIPRARSQWGRYNLPRYIQWNPFGSSDGRGWPLSFPRSKLSWHLAILNNLKPQKLGHNPYNYGYINYIYIIDIISYDYTILYYALYPLISAYNWSYIISYHVLYPLITGTYWNCTSKFVRAKSRRPKSSPGARNSAGKACCSSASGAGTPWDSRMERVQRRSAEHIQKR